MLYQTVKNGNSKAHTIGLGAMGLHTFFALNQMEYGSPESIEATDLYFRMLNFYTLKASNKIAKERGKSFEGFERSKYATGEYFDSYIAEDVQIKSEKVKKIFEKLPIPTAEDWKQLKRRRDEWWIISPKPFSNCANWFNQLRKRNKCFITPNHSFN